MSIQRYNIMAYYRDGLVQFENQPQLDGHWVKWEDVQALVKADDVRWLSRMEFTTFDREEADLHQAWFQAFRVRLAALLPPVP